MQLHLHQLYLSVISCNINEMTTVLIVMKLQLQLYIPWILIYLLFCFSCRQLNLRTSLLCLMRMAMSACLILAASYLLTQTMQKTQVSFLFLFLYLYFYDEINIHVVEFHSLLCKLLHHFTQRKWRFVIGFHTRMLFLISVGLRYL